MAAASDLAGRVLQGRYRLVSTIGAGAGGRVYAADDTQLSRRVAVKVLHDALASDNGFLRRFRAEAQVAASLNHPNIVTLHDWGEDGLPFMVMELLTGGSLRTLLDSGVRLTPAQAARVGTEAANALAYAHARGLIHRDIKPANVLFDEHGGVRIADFGLARAMAEASWTEPSGAMLGTARYASPEQASGNPLDGRADIYALGLVLHEAVTGIVPGVADTTIGTLAARTQFSLPDEPLLQALSPVVVKAGHADPEDRYVDATAMAEACREVAQALPEPEPLALTGMVETRSDVDQTILAAPAPVQLFDQDELSDIGPRRSSVSQRDDAGPVRTGWAVPIIVMLLIIAAFSGGAFALAQQTEESVAAPRLTGMSFADAKTFAKEQGFSVRAGVKQAANDPADLVLNQKPAPGEWVDGRTIVLDLSLGPTPVQVPSVVGTNLEVATATLDRRGLFLAEGEHRNDEVVPAGNIISQDPAAESTTPPESQVVVVVSDGPPVRIMPEVLNLPREQALQALQDAKLSADVSESEYSETVPKDAVIRASSTTGAQLPPGTTVSLVISKGSAFVTVPDVIGLSASEAKAKIEAQELLVAVTLPTGSISQGPAVTAQSPAGGSKLKRGATVTVVM